MRRRAGAALALGVCVLCFAQPARSQTPPQLVPLVTNQTPLALSNQFGGLVVGVVNDAGDYAFTVNRALFYRRAGWSAPVRVLQGGDEVPGVSGSHANSPAFLRINQSGLIAFTVDFVEASGRRLVFLGTFDGTTLVKIADGSDTAPGTGGAHYEANMTLFGVNDAGDIAFSSSLQASGTTLARPTLFFVPAGGAPVRLAGFGDAAPGTAGTFSAISSLNVGPSALNSTGDVLFQGTISGGPGGTGLFVASTGGVRKIVANGDPNPLGGTFAVTSSVAGRLNGLGEVAFTAGNSVWVNAPGTGTAIRVAVGSAVPAPIGGTFGTNPALQAFDDAGDIAFIGSVSGSAVSSSAVFRSRPVLPVEIVAYRNQVFPGAPAFGAFATVSMNGAGVIGFRGATIATAAVPSQSIGIFRQATGAPLEGLALDGQASPFGGTYDFDTVSVTQTLAGGAVYAQADLPNASTRYAEFLFSTDPPVTLMTTADSLPAGSRVDLTSGWIDGAGEYVGFVARRPGGSTSLAVHHITTNATTVLATDGDAAPGTGGGVLNLTNFSKTFINATGQTAFAAQVIGGAGSVRSGIFIASGGGGLSKIAVDGDLDADGRVLSAMALPTLSPRPINDAGQVVFTATSGTARGVFIGVAGAAPLRVARVGDLTSTGKAITAITGPQPGINASGQVAFLATTAVDGVGLFVGAPGSTPAKVAQAGNAAPGGGTFVAFAAPSFNNSGELAFMATVSGGAGIFVGSTSAAPIALALHGQPTPAGGTYSITLLRPDAVINDAHDVSFLSDLTGGSANSGYFVRRGSFGAVTPLILQGDPVPGSSETFMTFAHTLNTAVGEFNQIGDTGDVAVLGRYPAGGLNLTGTWHVKPDYTVEEILARGSIAPAFGGGTAVFTSQMSVWLSGSRYPIWARVSGGAFVDGIFLFVPPPVATLTPIGAGVVVTPQDATTGTNPVTLTFENVTTAGETTVTTSAGAPAIPSAYALGDPPVFYNVTTTAEFSGAITVCVDFSGTTFPPGSTLRLLHLENGTWQDVTTSGPAGGIICGAVTSLSPFAVVRLVAPALLPLTITADNQLRLAGASNPPFTVTYAGFVGSDGPANLTGALTCTTTAGPASPAGTYPITCSGQTSTTYAIAYAAGTLTVVPSDPSVSTVWVGLKNSDDVGTKFDLLVEILRNGVVVSTGQVNNVSGGSSGFNNAVLSTISAAATTATNYGTGDAFAVRLSVRIATGVSGHRSGTARLWFGDGAADSRVEAIVNGQMRSFYLRSGFQLSQTAGAGPKSSIDVFVDKLAGGNPFKPFGIWTITF